MHIHFVQVSLHFLLKAFLPTAHSLLVNLRVSVGFEQMRSGYNKVDDDEPRNCKLTYYHGSSFKDIATANYGKLYTSCSPFLIHN